MKKLKPRWKAFADSFIESGNMTDAAIKAGYSEKYARAQSYKLLENVCIAEYIAERTRPTEEKRIASGDEVIFNAIPMLKVLDLAYNVLFSDLDKAEKIILINELLCEFDKNGKPILTPEQKKLFVFTGEKLPDEKGMIQEYNPEIRIEQITKVFELALSLLSMSFGYGTKKYSFENGQITTATEYIGERQDQMQELNRQRQEAVRYIQDICRAMMWFSNTFQNTSYDLDKEILVDFDDSFITDKESELERRRNDALSFDIPELIVWYLMDAYSLTEKEATELVMKRQEADETSDIEDED